ncbi:hypothetical protein [Paenibacillus periandrae]|uniref:hypothetical protein n=1 Tax=Paenibacillus periandrae TaxID=1761741 RepID=UPI001F0914A5|nr:hypothetical protein [Paenibacillus periandrae]
MQHISQSAIKNEEMRRNARSSDCEMTDTTLMQRIYEASMEDGSIPGQERMTMDDHLAVAERLLNNQRINQIAITPEK